MIDLFTFTYNINVTMNAMFCFLFITIQWLASMPLVGFENHNKSLVRHFLLPSLAPTRDSYGSQCPLKSSCLISFHIHYDKFHFCCKQSMYFLKNRIQEKYSMCLSTLTLYRIFKFVYSSCPLFSIDSLFIICYFLV